MHWVTQNRTVFIALALMCMSYTTARIMKDPDAPLNYTGAPKATSPVGQVRYCSNSGCHSDFSLNTTGGSVVATGLPSGTYSAGQTYTFSITINHGSADKTNWGFAIKAVNAVDNDVTGTFSTTNANASVKGSVAGKSSELSHSNAPSSAASASYTFLNLKWTAPASPNVNEANIKFYIVGVAGDNDGSEAGDYVYSSVVSVSIGVLPVQLSSFTAQCTESNTVNLNWQTSQEINTHHFDVEVSKDAVGWNQLTTIAAAGNSSTSMSYTFTDEHPNSSNGNIFYRLKMNDINGAFSYTPVKQVKLHQLSNILIEQISPQQLSNGNIIFRISTKSNSSMQVTAFNFKGQMLYKNSVTISGYNTILEIPATVVAKANGMILINFRAEGFEKTFKQLIQ